MCMNVRWREHAVEDEEWDRLDNVHRDLCRAFEGDPSLPIPWREWAEVLDYLNHEDETATEVRRRAEQEPERPLLGYRRYPVHVRLTDGWAITIRGAMLEAWKESTWSAWDGERTLWFSCWNIEQDDEPVPAAELLARFAERIDLSGEAVQLKVGKLIGRGAIRPYEEDGEEMWNLKVLSAVDGRIALCTLVYHDEADREWALSQWRALTCTPG
jgi:hypothetical protein